MEQICGDAGPVPYPYYDWQAGSQEGITCGSTATVPGPKIPDCGKVSECVAEITKGPVIPVDGCYWFAPRIVVSRVAVDLVKWNLMELQITADLRLGACMDYNLPATAYNSGAWLTPFNAKEPE